MVIMGAAALAFVLQELLKRIPGVVGRIFGNNVTLLPIFLLSIFVLLYVFQNGFRIGGGSEVYITVIIGVFLLIFALPRLLSPTGRNATKEIIQQETSVRWSVIAAIVVVVMVAMLIDLYILNT